ncbi:MAG: Holliday junction branch migration protein RuvA [Candidatus Omnitrophota bacterium]
MISRISGKVIEKCASSLIIDTGGICYEVLIPAMVMERIQESIDPDGRISLVTFHYLQVEPSKTFPVLVGFANDVERSFFEVFITVSGIGPRAALKALNKPIPLIARAIDEGDLSFLKSLPGIGEQRAKEIVAKLQNKVGKFALIKDKRITSDSIKARDITEEALAVLMQLEYKKAEALNMIKRALEIAPDIQTAEEVLNVVYKQRKAK